jgi:3',5'-cyclic AMP phosphodiesterase CpdA
VRIVHLSDVHIWRFVFNPLNLLNKRAFGMASLLARRARRFRLERLGHVVARIVDLKADHILITGDLTTTALPDEFRAARELLAELLQDSNRVTVVPGNHDRYTSSAVRYRHFEEWFGAFAPPSPYPWLRALDDHTSILGLDATRSHISARGNLPTPQFDAARALLQDSARRPTRLIVACHYPVAAPAVHAKELALKPMTNQREVGSWLGTIGPHLFCCGHVHAAWAFMPTEVPGQLSLNAGAPLLRDHSGLRPPGFLEITLHDRDVTVLHHAWVGDAWDVRAMHQKPDFFASRDEREQNS